MAQPHSELVTVAWATAAVVAAGGTAVTAVALICKASQWCRSRWRRRRKAGGCGGDVGEGGSGVDEACRCSCFGIGGNDEQGSRTSVYSFDDFVQRSQSQGAATKERTEAAGGGSPDRRRQRRRSQRGGPDQATAAAAAACGRAVGEAPGVGDVADSDEEALAERHANADVVLRQLAPAGSQHSLRERYEMEWPPVSRSQSPRSSRLNLHAAERPQARRGHIIFGRSFANPELIHGQF